MTNSIIFVNTNLFLSGTIVDDHFLIIKNGLIERFGKMSELDSTDGYEIIDCTGLLISSGLIDIHVHFRDPGNKFKEDMQSGSKSAIAGGFTTVVCQPNTTPPLDNILTVDYLKKQIDKSCETNIKFYCSATKGSLGKEISSIQSLRNAGAVGFTDDGLPISNARIMMDLFRYSALLNVPIAQHAEDLSITNGGCVHHGKFAEQFNLKTTHPASEYSIIARDISLMEDIPNARYHVLHVSSEQSLKYIRDAKNRGLKVTAEITPHHFTSNNDILYENWSMGKMNPPLRKEADVESMISGMKDGTIDIIASDHAPHDHDSKEKSISCASFGIIGLETMLPLSLELYHKNLLSLERILTMLTTNPAHLIGEYNRDSIKVGKMADLCVLDIHHEWTINSDNMLSKSKNTPFNGRKVKGINRMTIIGGKVVYYSAESVSTCNNK